jgi:hypothetical protein
LDFGLDGWHDGISNQIQLNSTKKLDFSIHVLCQNFEFLTLKVDQNPYFLYFLVGFGGVYSAAVNTLSRPTDKGEQL